MKNKLKKGKKVSILILSTIFSAPLLFSCGAPEVTAATGYKTSSSASPGCTCEDATPKPTATPLSTNPTPVKTPGVSSTDKDYGWQSPEPGVTPTPSSTVQPPAAPEKKQSFISKWVEKIGNIFKKKKTT